LESVAYNINRRNKNLKLYEIGRTYHRVSQDNTIKDFEEKKVLSIFLTGNTHEETWQLKSEQFKFNHLTNTVQQIIYALNLQGVNVVKSGSEIHFKKGEKSIAKAYLVPAKWLKLVDIKQPVFYAELDMDLIIKYTTEKLKYKEIAKYPEVRRDLSLVIDKSVTFDQIRAITNKTERKLLKNINVFDVYQGDKIEQGKKAYAISYILQDENQTLTDQQIDNTMQRLIEAYKSELGAVIRQ
jgi:phenylalanyl-tRNA synthetase beta chain